uniref:CSON011897 protein n=1 Tax=Culicoides sonorensis TaxID=179676 RepID=A0A336M9L4_CULSO
MSQIMGPNSDTLTPDGIDPDRKPDNETTSTSTTQETVNEKTLNENNRTNNIQINNLIKSNNSCDNKKSQVTVVNGSVKSDEKTTKLKQTEPRELTEEECDEVLTVILSEEIPETNSLTIIEEKIENKSSDENKEKTFPKSILSNNINGNGSIDKPLQESDNKVKASFRKKSVSFENDETIKKFTGGEEIVDQENPFKPEIISETGVNYKFIKKNKLSKKSSIPASLPQAQTVRAVIRESDFITKEEILKQSKYVPVYVKNPDPILTYDKSIIDRLSSVESEVEEPPTPRTKKFPIPAPRKISKLPALTANSFIGKKDVKKRHFLKQKNKGNYPDLSDIKVKTGTDWEESLYDPNEVAINVIKFDSLLKKKKYKSEEDSDETEVVNAETSSSEENQESKNNIKKQSEDEPDSNNKKSSEQKSSSKDKDDDSSGKGSYTNTVTSSEFKEFLRKKGLTLVPNTLRLQAINNKKVISATTPHQNGVGHKAIIAEMEKSGEKKSSILRRLFQGNLFSSRKTSPKAPVPQPQQVFSKPVEKESVVRKRLGLSNGKSSVLADNEFTTHFRKEQLSKKSSYDDDRGSSISSMLTAAEDYLDMQSPASPKSPRSTYLDMIPNSNQKKPSLNRGTSDLIQRSSEINRAKSAMLKAKPGALRSQSTQSFKVSSRLAQPLTFEKSSPQPGDGVLKPKVQRPGMPNGTAGKQKPPVPVRTVSDRTLNNKQLYAKENGRMNRSLSMDREEIRLRSKPPQPLERTTKSLTANKTPQKQINVEAQLNRLVQGNDSPERTIEGPVKTSTPKTNHPTDAVTPMTKDRQVISPVAQPKEKTPEIDPYLYVKLHELKRKTDDELLNKASQNNSIFPKAIYGKTVNGRTSVPLQNMQENLYEQRPQIPQTNGNFIRNSPQRNTVTGALRPKTGGPEDYQRQAMTNNYGYVNGNVSNNSSNSSQNQPMRSQSVLDGVTGSPMYGSMRYRMSNNNTPVQLRKGGTLDRKQILNQIYEFYRRSVNNTPNKMNEDQLYSRPSSIKSGMNVSPNSYASVRVHPPPPELRQRSQSVQQQPIYGNRNAINAAIYAQARSISQTANAQQNVNGQRISVTSDNDSVFLAPAPPNTYKTLSSNNKDPRKNYVILEGEQITPWDVLKYRSVPNTPQRDQIYSVPRKPISRQDVYGKIYDTGVQSNKLQAQPQQQQQQRRPASVTPYNGQPTYQPSQVNGRVRLGADGRSTPLILSSVASQQQQNQQSPVKPSYAEPLYRPIQMNRRPLPQSPLVMQQNPYRKNSAGSQELLKDKSLRLPMPYESDTGSEAGEIQRILYNRQNDEI